MILCIQNKPGTFTRQDPSPPLRFPFSRVPYSSSQLPIAACTYYTNVRERHNFRCTYHMRMHMQFRLGCRLPCLWLEKMSETSVKIIKNEVRCRDDTVPKSVGIRKHCKVGLRACNNLPQPPPYIFVFRGCGRLLHALNPTLQYFLVSTVFGTVSSLHLTSFLMIFYTCSYVQIRALYLTYTSCSVFHTYAPRCRPCVLFL